MTPKYKKATGIVTARCDRESIVVRQKGEGMSFGFPKVIKVRKKKQ
jgi:hypothetical protein